MYKIFTIGCLTILGIDDSDRWDQIVKSFLEYDVYYLSNYVKAFQLHGDGTPLLMYFENDCFRAMSVVMIRDIALCPQFNGLISPNRFFDVTTPYGYGGFIFEGDTSEKNLREFYDQYTNCLKKANIISCFRRYHPQLKNADLMRKITNVIDLGETVTIDVTNENIIWENMTSDCRNRIKKSINSGVKVHHEKSIELMYEFVRLYNYIMDKDIAEPYYYFKKDFFESIHFDLNENYELFYATLDEKIVAMAIIIYANKRMHCHFLASEYEYRVFAPSNLLIYKAACWGSKIGMTTMHLGGGINSKNDNLLRFKKTFNRNSNGIFSIGTEIVDKKTYDYLVGIRQKNNSHFDISSSYFPLYRAI